MYVTPEQIAATNKATSRRASVAAAQFAAFEKLANLQAAAEVGVRGVHRQHPRAGRRQDAEFFFPSALEKPAFSKNVYEVATGPTAAVELAESRIADWNQNFVSVLDKASKNAPAGSDVAVAAVKSMLAAANSAYDSMNKVAKRHEIAEANVAAATETGRAGQSKKRRWSGRAAPRRKSAGKAVKAAPAKKLARRAAARHAAAKPPTGKPSVQKPKAKKPAGKAKKKS
jgi:hypothetical protein